MRLLLHYPQHFQERADLVSGNRSRDRAFEGGEVREDLGGHLAAFGRRVDHEGATVVRADLPRDQSTFGQAIENARERRAFVGEVRMEIRNRGRRRRGEVREDVRLSLRETVLAQAREKQADAVGGAVNRRNETQGHGSGWMSGSTQPTRAASDASRSPE